MANALAILREHLSRYQLHERLGSGGMATVYRATDKNLGREVAIKILHEHLLYQESFKERFEQEARFIASFNHPNIVQVYDFDTLEIADSKIYYMVMPYLAGKSLVDILAESRSRELSLSHERVKQITIDIASALDYAHERGMVHRDVKPANIIFDENNRAILTDFGIARLAQASGLTAEGLIVGTPAYMSPEQVTGQAIDHRSDIYSLACILFEMLTGRTPFEDDGTVALLLKHAQELPPSVSKFIEIKNPAIDYVLERALSKDPDDRYQKASALARDLQETIDAESNTERFKPAILPKNLAANSVTPTLLLEESQAIGNRLTRTIQTLIIKPAKQNPLGFVALAIALLALLIVARMAQPSPANSNETSDVDSMTAPMYFAADFDEASELNAYWQKSAGTITRQIIAGEYLISNTESRRAITSLIEPATFTFEDSYITIQGRILESSASESSAFGLVFRYQDADNYYVFGVDGAGRYSIWKLEAGTWCELRTVCNAGASPDEWTEHPAIRPLGEENIINLNAYGTTLSGYVNGEEVFMLEDATFVSGGLGIYTATTNAGATHVVINRYEVSAGISPTASMTNETDSMTNDTDSMTGEESTETTTEEN